MRTARGAAMTAFFEYLNEEAVVTRQNLERDDLWALRLPRHLLAWIEHPDHAGAEAVAGSYATFLQVAMFLLLRFANDPEFRIRVDVEGSEPRSMVIGDEDEWADLLSEDAFRRAVYAYEQRTRECRCPRR